MVFIMNGKTYDTEKSKKIFEFRRKWYFDFIGGELGIYKRTNLYKSKKGNWFITAKGDYDKDLAMTLTEDEVKEIFSQCNKVDLYNEHFDDLEEA